MNSRDKPPTGTPGLAGRKKPAGRAVEVEDIAERTPAEETLRLQSAALNAAANAIVIADTAGTITWANQAFTDLTGYTLAEAVGKSPRELVNSGRQDRALYEVMWATILAGQVWRGELVNRRKDGSLYPEEMTITPVRNATGVITHFIAIKQDLTERKRAEQALRESERKFQSVFEQAAAGVIIVEGPRGRLVNVNRCFCEMLGYIEEELLQLHIHDITHPEDIPEDLDRLEQISSGLIRDFSREKRYRRKDGSYIWAKVFVALLNPSEKNPIVRIGVIVDITERKKAEMTLSTAGERYTRQRDAMITLTGSEAHKVGDLEAALRRITETSGRTLGVGRTSIWRYNPDRTAIHCLDLYELEADRHTSGMELTAANYPDYFRALARMDVIAVEVSCDNPITREFSETYFRPLGITSLLDASIHLRGSVEGVLCHEHVGPPRTWNADEAAFATAVGNLVSLAWEANLREQAERALRESEERYRLLFENNPLSMWLYDLETLRFLAVNESAVQHYGYTRTEFLAMTIKQIRPAEDIPELLKFVSQMPFEDRNHSEWRHQRKDGSIIQVEIVSRPLVFDGRRARLVLASDITEKKLIEEKFLHAQRLESIGMLAAGIAHDLNNVLAPILFAAPLLRGSLPAERDLRVLDTLERSATRGAGLVKQILGFAHSTTGDFRSTQVKHLARDISSLIEETFPKSIEFRHEIPSDLWPVLGNPTQIHQVLMNLCVNARDAMPQGGTLSLTAANRRLDAAEAATLAGGRAGDWLVLTVSDTGSGMSSEVLENIWTPFFTTKAVGKGTGLGLTTIRGIVTSHHGFITIDTAVGRGSTFRVFLPAAEGATVGKQSASPFANHRGNGELILVVDDDAAIHSLVAAILTKFGYRVLKCLDGVEALALFRAQPGEFALVITDVDMPRLGGLALANALLLIRPDILILGMSGLSHVNAVKPNLPTIHSVAHEFLLKPFKAEALLATVHRLLHPADGPKPV